MNIKRIISIFIIAALLSLSLASCAGCADDGYLSFEEYSAMSESDQIAYYESFENPEDFFAWYNEAKAEYDKEHPTVPPTGGGESEGGSDIGGSFGEGDKLPEEPSRDGDTPSEPESEGGSGSDAPSEPENPDIGGSDEPENPDIGDTGSEKVTYADYLAMSQEEQLAYYESFEDPQDFFDWFNEEKAKYDEENKGEELPDDGNIDLGQSTEP